MKEDIKRKRGRDPAGSHEREETRKEVGGGGGGVNRVEDIKTGWGDGRRRKK